MNSLLWRHNESAYAIVMPTRVSKQHMRCKRGVRADTQKQAVHSVFALYITPRERLYNLGSLPPASIFSHAYTIHTRMRNLYRFLQQTKCFYLYICWAFLSCPRAWLGSLKCVHRDVTCEFGTISSALCVFGFSLSYITFKIKIDSLFKD